ncbi:hypothetical protein IMY05_004G0007800 [Salix suchowensis]|nr:hypothetical protein IMY05_004G0007800 [Salix suchowensis]
MDPEVHQLAARIIEKAAINLTYLDRSLSGKYASLLTSVLKKQEDSYKFTCSLLAQSVGTT